MSKNKDMKRTHEENEYENDTAKRVKESDVSVLTTLKDKYSQAGEEINKELERTTEKYYVSFLKKVILKLPLSKEILDSTKDVGDGYDSYLTMFSIAKTCVHSEIQMKKLMAFNAVFDMISSLIGKSIHDRIITPYMSRFLPEEHLAAAFASYQECLSSEQCNASTELHCITYLIQTEIEKKEPLKIPNPMRNRATQHLKAVSEYITKLLSQYASLSPLTKTSEEK